MITVNDPQLNMICLDTETGGLDHKNNGLTELGLVVFRFERDTNGFVVPHIINEKSWLIKPLPEKTYEPRALEIQGRTLQYLYENGQDLYQVMMESRKFMIDSIGIPGLQANNWVGRVWAHNADFDYRFVQQAERDAMIEQKFFGYRDYFGCSRRHWQNLKGLGYHGVPQSSLKDISLKLGTRKIEDAQTHHSIDDCKLTIATLAEIENLTVGRVKSFLDRGNNEPS